MAVKLSRRLILSGVGATALAAGGYVAFGSYQRSTIENAVLPWIKANATGFDPKKPDSIWSDKLANALSSVRLLGLGEATHGSHEDAAVKSAIIKGLVASGAVTSFFFEVNNSGGRELDAFINGETGDPVTRVKTAKIFNVVKTKAVAELLGWLRDHNKTAKTPVRIFGIDCQSTALDALIALEALRSIDPKAALAFDAPLAPIVSQKAQDLHFSLLIKSLTTAQLQTAMKALEELRAVLKTYPDAKDAHYAALTAWQGLKSFEMETSDGKITGDEAAYFARRDVFMAENILQLLGDHHAVFWAHNNHVITDAPNTGYTPTGKRLRQAMGNDYRALVIDYGRARFNAVPQLPVFSQAKASDPQQVIDWSNKSGRMAGLLDRAELGSYWVELSALPKDAAGLKWRKLSYRVDWPGWGAPKMQALNIGLDFPHGTLFDFVVYIEAMTPSQKL